MDSTSRKGSGLWPRPTSGPYARAWRDYKRRIILPWIFVLAFVVLPYPSVLLLRAGVPPWACILLFLAILIAILVSYFRMWVFPCPRCGQLFRKSWKWYGSQCVHCGLPKWADSNADGSTSDPGPRPS